MVTDTDEECQHRTTDPALGFGGDPAREDPRRAVCADCGASLHIETDEDGLACWEED